MSNSEKLDLREIEVDLDREDKMLLRVQYDVASAREIYPEIVDWVREAPFLTLGSRAMEAIKPVIVSWDIQNEDGTPYTPQPDNLEKMPIKVLSCIISAIAEDLAR